MHRVPVISLKVDRTAKALGLCTEASPASELQERKKKIVVFRVPNQTTSCQTFLSIALSVSHPKRVKVLLQDGSVLDLGQMSCPYHPSLSLGPFIWNCLKTKEPF